MAIVANQIDISKALTIPGWMSERELVWLATQAQKCEKIVEFGSFHGRSTRALADNIKEGGRIWAVDPWGGDCRTDEGNIVVDIDTYCMPYFRQNLKDHIDTERVKPVRYFSYMFTLPFQVDMVFIDGDHRYNTVVRDIDKAQKLVKEGGIIAGHDYEHRIWPGVKKAVDETFKQFQIEDTIWWTIKY